MNEETKKIVFSKISGSQNWFSVGRAKIRVGNNIIHVRYKSKNLRTPAKYIFNINPNTLSADYELWICSKPDTYYLIPISVIKKIYSDPNSYKDYHHPEIRIVTIDSNNHYVTYARPGKSLSLIPFLGSDLNQ